MKIYVKIFKATFRNAPPSNYYINYIKLISNTYLFNFIN